MIHKSNSQFTTDRQIQLVEDNLAYANRLAINKSRNLPDPILKENLMAAAQDGLMQAALSYDERKGVQFKTFAARRINGAMLDHMRDCLTTSRQAHKIAIQVLKDFEPGDVAAEIDKMGKGPATKSEIQDAVCAQINHSDTFVYLDQPINGTNGSEFRRELKSQAQTPEEILLQAEKSAVVQTAIEKLPIQKRDQKIVKMYFLEEGNTMADIASVTGITESRVSQIVIKAKKILSKSSDLKRLSGHSHNSSCSGKTKTAKLQLALPVKARIEQARL